MLKKLRVVISLLFFILTGFIFIDLGNWLSSTLVNKIVFLQFFPSLLKFLNILSFFTCGFIIIILITIVFGRVYCSTVCPLGTLQDIISYLSGKFRRFRIYRINSFSLPSNRLRYTILVITFFTIPAGSLVISLLDPYSNFGRIVANLFRPVYISGNDLLAVILERLGWYGLSRIGLKHIDPGSLLFAFFVFVVIAALSVSKGRLFCNTICPAGSFLGLLSRFSLFRFVFDEDSCTRCFRCEGSCKSRCIDSDELTIDMSRCVSCFNCIESCPSGGMIYGIKHKPSKKVHNVDLSRRENIKTGIGVLSLISGLSLSAARDSISGSGINTTVPVRKKYPVTPPGSFGIEYFGKSCTACHLCISRCPTRVLQPSVLEYGIEGIFQPFMDYSASYCNFECTVCGNVCPTGAILPVPADEKKQLQLGKSVFVKENCIVEIKKTECGACSEHCPTKAVQMAPYTGKIKIPVINNIICIGCGACEYACPVKPYKAIYVDGNPVHLVAEKPEVKKTEKKKENGDFPF